MSDRHPGGKPRAGVARAAESAGVAGSAGAVGYGRRPAQNSASVRNCRVTMVFVVPVFWAQTL